MYLNCTKFECVKQGYETGHLYLWAKVTHVKSQSLKDDLQHCIAVCQQIGNESE